MKKEMFLAKDKDAAMAVCYSSMPEKREVYYVGDYEHFPLKGFEENLSFEDEPKKIFITDVDTFGEIKAMKEGILELIKHYLKKVETIDEIIDIAGENDTPNIVKTTRGAFKVVINDLRTYYEEIKDYGKEED